MRTADMPVLCLRGTARERGLAHGEALRPQIASLLGSVKDAIGHKGGVPPDAYFEEFFSSLRVWAPLAGYDPSFLEEIEAIAAGSGQRTADIAVLNLLDEEIWYGRARLMGATAADAAAGGVAQGKCSVFAVAGPDGTLLGQNMDIATWTDGAQVLLHVQPAGTDLEYYAFSCAGMLGLCGVNNRGLGVCVNNLLHLDPSPDGRPVLSTVRALLSTADVDAATRVLRSTRHASGQCFTVGQAGRVAGFECSASRCVQYTTWPDGSRLVHTNHALQNSQTHDVDRLRDAGAALGLPRFFFDVTRDSRDRQAEMQRLFGDFSTPVTLEYAKRALSHTGDPGYPICRTGVAGTGRRNLAFTTGSVVWELGATVRAHVAAGPPDRTDYAAFTF